VDWDDEMDGEWEAPLVENPRCKEAPGCGPWSRPLIDNPAYKGVWRPPLVQNPLYKGIWKPRKIENPDYFEEVNPFERVTPIDAIGLELWTMSENVAFDNFILADDVSVVDRWTEETWVIKTAKEGATAPSGPTVLHQLFDAANERPWLWLVYMIGLLIPICVMTMIFCPVKKDKENADTKDVNNYDAVDDETTTTAEALRETKEEEALRKKTDEPIPDVVEEEEEEESTMPELEDIVLKTTPDMEMRNEEPMVRDILKTTPEMGDAVLETTPEMENVLKTTPVKLNPAPAMQETPEKTPAPMTPINGATNGTSNGFGHDEGLEDVDEAIGFFAGGGGGGGVGKSVLNGITDEDDILRRSPRLKSKTRSRKE